MSTGKKVAVVVGVTGVIVALGALSMRGGDRGVEVRTETIARRDLVQVVTASGKIEPKRKVDISADISGRVVQVAVEEGQWVDQGDLLLRIDPTMYQAAVRRAQAAVQQNEARAAQARAQLINAQSAQRRAEQLMETNELISAADVEQARTQAQVAEQELQAARFAVNQAQAALTEARDQLSKTTIAAPMSGRVTRLNIDEGETAVVGTMNNPGSLLLTIADLSVMEAVVEVDETDVPGLTIGDSASVRVDAFPGTQFPGRVTAIGNSSIQVAGAGGSGERQSVDYEVVITLDNPPAELRPDLSATAEIVTETRRNALTVPILALTVRDPEGRKFEAAEEDKGAPRQASRRREELAEVEGVFIVTGDSVAWAPVTIGITGDRYFEVVDGLKGGETVVSGTYQTVRDLQAGDPVRRREADAETAEKGEAAADSAERRKG